MQLLMLLEETNYTRKDEMIMSEEISRKLITTYRKRLWSPFTKAIRDYALIQENDKVAVCISGVKDSFSPSSC